MRGAELRLLLLLLRERREEGEARATEWREGSGGAGRRPDQGGGGGRPRRAQRRRTAATWPSLDGARRAPRAGERREGEAGRAASWVEREAGLAQQRLSPLYFFEILSQFLSKFIWTIKKLFSPFFPKSKVVPKQKPYNFVLISKTKFQIEFEL